MQSFCWWCGRPLKLPHFSVVIDQLGHRQKVHKACAEDAKTYMKPLTADISKVHSTSVDKS